MNSIVSEWVEKAEGDFQTAEREMRARKAPNYDAVCFHAQQKVYFWDETGKEWCVSDYPDLVARLMEICRDYFAHQAAVRSGNEKSSGQALRTKSG
jgi:hypothetical protein